MQCIFEIRYQIRWHSAAPDHWEEGCVRVLSGPDAQEAVAKVREMSMGLHQMSDNGLEERCTGFRLREVLLVAEASL